MLLVFLSCFRRFLFLNDFFPLWIPIIVRWRKKNCLSFFVFSPSPPAPFCQNKKMNAHIVWLALDPFAQSALYIEKNDSYKHFAGATPTYTLSDHFISLSLFSSLLLLINNNFSLINCLSFVYMALALSYCIDWAVDMDFYGDWWLSIEIDVEVN